MDLSIIVPVYNVEKYIRMCLLSIFQQGLEDSRFEVIVINDGSTDQSINVIEDIIGQHPNIIIVHEENQGLSVARNNGIAKAKGKYILFIDSDDMLVTNSLCPILDKAIEYNADLVVADFIKLENEDTFKEPSLDSNSIVFEEKNGEELLLELNEQQCFVWRTIYRKEFLIERDISFVPNIYYEDVPFTHECYIKATRCLKTTWPIYVYKLRSGSITSSFNIQKAESFIISASKTWGLLYKNRLSPKCVYKIEEDVYIMFKTIIYNTLHSIKDSKQRKQIIDLFNIKIPMLSFHHTLRQRLTTFMVKNMPHTFIEIYYFYSKLFY